MTDIVEKLRDPSKGSPRWMDTMNEAADEIERLRDELSKAQKDILIWADKASWLDAYVLQVKENDRLREALRQIADRGVETFHINPMGGDNICVEGSDRFAHERDVVAVFEIVRAALGAGHD